MGHLPARGEEVGLRIAKCRKPGRSLCTGGRPGRIDLAIPVPGGLTSRPRAKELTWGDVLVKLRSMGTFDFCEAVRLAPAVMVGRLVVD